MMNKEKIKFDSLNFNEKELIKKALREGPEVLTPTEYKNAALLIAKLGVENVVKLEYNPFVMFQSNTIVAYT